MKKHFDLYSLALSALIAIMGSGCSLTDTFFGSSGSPITHLPIKLSKSGRWGFANLKGEIICEDEFKNKPGLAVNNITRVRNDNNEVEYYIVGGKVEQIGETYLYGTTFSEGLAMVVKENGHISAINEKGEDVFTLDSKDEEAILVAGNFHGNLAPAMNAKNEWGYIDTEGNISIKCQYSKAEGFNDGFARVAKDNKILIIDKSGNVVHEPKAMKAVSRVQEDAFVYADETSEFGLMDLKGERLIKANPKYAYMSPPQHDLVVYASEANSEFGVMNIKGEILLRPKYNLIIVAENLIFAMSRGKNTIAFDHSGTEVWKLDVDAIFPLSSDVGIAIDGNDMELISLEDRKTMGKETFAEVGINPKDLANSITGSQLFSWTEFVSSDYANPDAALTMVMSQLKVKDFYGAGQNGGYAQARKAFETINGLDMEFASASINGMDDRYFWSLNKESENETTGEAYKEDEGVEVPAADTAAIIDEAAESAITEEIASSDPQAVQLKAPEIKDAAPELNNYTTTLYTNDIQIDRKLSLSVSMEFNDRLKREV